MLGTAASLLGAGSPSAADPTPSLALEPAPAGDRGFAVQRAGASGHLLLSARLLVDYASEPLVLANARQEADAIVSQQLWLHALASFALAHRLVVHLDAPFVLLEGTGDPPANGAASPRADGGFQLGDLRLGAR